MKKPILLITSFFISNLLFSQKNLDIIKVPDPNHAGQTIDCPMEGNAKKGKSKEGQLAWMGNPKKNRWDIPDSPAMKTIRIEDLISRDANKTKFKQGTAVKVKGYVHDVKPGGVESCNCDTKAIGFRDTHIVITPDASRTSEEFRMIAEVTPRIRMLMNDRGLDWSTANLRNELQGREVIIQGWLFYDEVHEHEAFATNPDNRDGNNWRASCWEVHPVTSLKVSGSLNNASAEDEQVITTQASEEKTGSGATQKSPRDIFFIILLGSVLGILGQSIRTIVGLKKLYDASRNKKNFYEMFSSKKLFLSFAVAAVIGFVAGALMAIYNIDTNWDNSTVLATIGAGYAGVDFIEGILGKNFLAEKS